MELEDGEVVAAALYTAASNMFSFALTALRLALKYERMGGFTAQGLQIEPPVAHVVRPALESFIAEHQTVGDKSALTEAQATMADRMYLEHLMELRDQLLAAIHEFET